MQMAVLMGVAVRNGVVIWFLRMEWGILLKNNSNSTS